MIESKAIDDSVKNLLSDVRNQADRYRQLFDELESLRDAVGNELAELKEFAQSYEAKFSEETSNLATKYESSVKLIEDKISKIKDFELNFNKLEELKSNFELILKDFDSQSNEFIQSFLDFKDSIDGKFSDEVKSFRNYTDKAVDLEIRHLESRIYDRIRKVDRHLEHYDKRIYDADLLQTKTNKSIYKQLNSIEGFLNTIKALTESSVKAFNNDLRNTETHLLEKIDIIDERQEKVKKIEFIDDIIELDKALAKQKKEIEEENKRVQKMLKGYEVQITALRSENKQLEAQINSGKTISTVAIVVAVVALLLMVVVAVVI